MGALRDSLKQLPALRNILENLLSDVSPEKSVLLKRLMAGLQVSSEVLTDLLSSLQENPPTLNREGSIFIDGWNEELDHIRTIRRKGHSWLSELEASERSKTGISSLKIKYNGVQGYFIEVTKTHIDKVPDYYVKKQSTVSGERYITPELKNM